MTARTPMDGNDPISSPLWPDLPESDQSSPLSPDRKVAELAKANRSLAAELRRAREENIRVRNEQVVLKEELRTARENRAIIRDSTVLMRATEKSELVAPEIIGRSPAWRDLLKQIEIVAPTNATVL